MVPRDHRTARLGRPCAHLTHPAFDGARLARAHRPDLFDRAALAWFKACERAGVVHECPDRNETATYEGRWTITLRTGTRVLARFAEGKGGRLVRVPVVERVRS